MNSADKIGLQRVSEAPEVNPSIDSKLNTMEQLQGELGEGFQTMVTALEPILLLSDKDSPNEKAIADSRSPQGDRLTSMITRQKDMIYWVQKIRERLDLG